MFKKYFSTRLITGGRSERNVWLVLHMWHNTPCPILIYPKIPVHFRVIAHAISSCIIIQRLLFFTWQIRLYNKFTTFTHCYYDMCIGIIHGSRISKYVYIYKYNICIIYLVPYSTPPPPETYTHTIHTYTSPATLPLTSTITHVSNMVVLHYF